MTKKKISGKEAIRRIDESFQKEVESLKEIHDDIVANLVIPLIEQGLVDDVESGPVNG